MAFKDADVDGGIKNKLAEDPKRKFLGNKGKLRTYNLFVEHNFNDSPDPMYSLKDHDYKGYPSLKKLYLAENDITGYLFAEKYLYNFEHFLILKATKMVGHYFEAWERELELKLEAEAIQSLAKISKGTTKDALSAAKFLASRGWKKNPRGRPSKDDVNHEIKKQANVQQLVEEDAERINGNN